MSKPKEKIIELRPKQKIAWEYLNNPKYAAIRDIGYGGSAGGGKSILGAAWIIHMARTHPKTRYACCAYDIKKAEDSIYHSLIEVFQMLGMEQDKDYSYNVKRHTFTILNNNSEIELFGLTYKPADPNNLWLGGYLFTCSWIDESNAVDSRIIDTFTSRNGRFNNEVFVKDKDMTDEEKKENPDWEIKGGYNKVIIPTKILQTFNPSQNHVYSQFWLPYKNKKQTTSRFVRAYAWDNYSKDSQYVKSLKQLRNRVTRERLLFGSFEFNASDKALFDSDAVQEMVNIKIPPEQSTLLADRYMIIDVADAGVESQNDMTTIGYFVGTHCVGIEDFEYKHSDDLIKKILKEKADRVIPMENIVVDANGSGSYVASDSRLDGCLGFKAHYSPVKHETGKVLDPKKKKNRMSTRLESTYRTLKDQCVHLLSELVNDRKVGANIDNELLKDYLKQELLIYEHVNLGTDRPMEVTKKIDIRSNIKRSPDTSDLFIMLMYPYLLDRGIIKAKPLEERKFTTKKRIRNNYA